MPHDDREKRRVVILGGGISAMTTAYYLTNEPAWHDKYESITVYQLGWRLGGKGASGRNQARHNRIEEHGIHFFFGFYDNAFRIMRDTYEELGRALDAPLSRAIDGPNPAFRPGNSTTLMENQNGQWKRWDIEFPPKPGLPGDDLSSKSPWGAFLELLHWMRDYASGVMERHNASLPAVEPRRDLSRAARKAVFRLLSEPEVDANTQTPLHLATKLAERMPEDVQRLWQPHYRLLQVILTRQTEELVEQLRTQRSLHDEIRRAWIVLRLALAVARGMLRDGVVRYGYDAVEHFEFIDWLKRHGARDPEVWQSAIITNLYSAALAFDPKTGDPNLSAASALRALFRLFFKYKRAFLWKMQSGMGDVVFAPLYEVLERRGVKFEFFHRVKELKLSADQTRIEAIDLGVQATLKETHSRYDPLITVEGLPAWPAQPRFKYLNEGAELESQGIDLESAWTTWVEHEQPKRLELGKDFDDVVLGISVGGLPFVAPELIKANKRWRRMVKELKTVQTEAMQLWMTGDLERLGWQRFNQDEPLIAGYIRPFDSWSDMTNTKARESWPADANVKNISYFINVLQEDDDPPLPFEDPGFPQRCLDQVKKHSRLFLSRDVAQIWPGSMTRGNPSQFDWDLLVDLDAGSGEGRLEYQFARANVNPSDRYVLSAANTSRFRLKPGDSGFQNLFLTGDWTDNGFNMGSAEAATISGIQAARAISGKRIEIAGEAELGHPLPSRLSWAWERFVRALLHLVSV